MLGKKSVNNPHLTTRIQQIWNGLITPFHPLPNPQETYRARALAALTLSQMVLGALVLVYVAIAYQDKLAGVAGIVVAFVLDMPIYLLSRTRYYRLAAILHTSLILLTVVALITHSDHDVSDNAPYFFIFSVLVASMFLSRRVALGIAAFGALAVFILSLIQPDIGLLSPALLPFIGFAISIVLVESYLHDRDLLYMTQQTKALTASEIRYRSVMETTFDAMLLHNDSTIASINEGFTRVFGYAVEEVIGRPISQFFFTEDGNPLPSNHHFHQTKKSEILTVRHKTGAMVDVEWVMSGFDHDAHTTQVAAIREISHLRQAERIRRADDLRYRALFEQTNDLVILVGLDRRILAANQQACKTLGYPEHHLIGEEYSIIRLSSGDFSSLHTLQRLFSGEKMAFHEQTLLRANGTSLSVEVNVVLVRNADDKPSHIQYIARDITDRKAAERERLENDLRFRALFEQTTDGVTLFDLDGKIIAMNPQSAAMLGKTVNEMMGQDADSGVKEEERRDSRDMLRRLLAGEQIPVYERTFQHKNGSDVHVEINASLVRDVEGNPRHIQSIMRDITGRKAADIKRRKDDARYRALFEQTNDMVFLMSLDARLLDVNQQGAMGLGYMVEELIGQPVARIANPYQTEAEHRHSIISRLTTNEMIPTYEYDFYRKDGSSFTAEVTVSLVHDADGNPTHVQSVMRDITEHKAAERAQLEDELRYRALFEQSNDMVFLVGLDNKLIAANQQAMHILDYTADELRDLPIDAVVPPDELEKSMRIQERLLAGEKIPIYERIFVKKNGERFPAEVNVALVYDLDGNPSHLQSLVRDITSRKQAQARYRALFDQTRDAVFLVSLDDYVVMVNQPAAEMTGYSIGRLLQMTYDELVVESEHSDSNVTFQRLKAGQQLPVYERTFRRNNREEFPVEISAVLVRDTDGNPVHIQCVVRETTERKRSQEQQLDLAIVRERVHVLQEFIDHASHDFGTPLTNIKTSLYLLRKAHGDPQKQEVYIERLETHANRLERLLGDLLAMSRLEKDSTGRMRYARMDVNMLVREVAARQADKVASHGHHLNMELVPELAPILADKMALSDALTEVLENATIYTKTGGNITIRTRQDNNMVQIEIEDTGIGLDGNDMPHIFNSFYRADTSRSTDTGGTGLGLTIAKKIIDAHDGTITVTSTPGKGSVFTIRLRVLRNIEPNSQQ